MAGDDFVAGGSGKDMITGGNGNDQISGGNDNDTLVGDFGSDAIVGNAGRDLLIGGRNGDRLSGNENGDLLIAGSTLFDNHDAALKAILLEWGSNRTYVSRIANLKGIPNPFFAARINGNFFLQKGITVQDDDALDVLTGGDGMDWYLFDQMAPPPKDIASDKEVDEEIY